MVVKPYKASEFKSETLIDRRKCRRSKGQISLKEKIEITKKVLVDYVKQADVAREYRVTIGRISQLVKLSRKNPKYLNELMSKK